MVKSTSVIVLCLAVSVLLAACGGKIASTGCARVVRVTCDGMMTLQYANGSVQCKRIDCENIPADVKTARKHLLQPARFVETEKESVLHFASGDTLLYRHVKKSEED